MPQFAATTARWLKSCESCGSIGGCPAALSRVFRALRLCRPFSTCRGPWPRLAEALGPRPLERSHRELRLKGFTTDLMAGGKSVG